MPTSTVTIGIKLQLDFLETGSVASCVDVNPVNMSAHTLTEEQAETIAIVVAAATRRYLLTRVRGGPTATGASS